MSHDDVRSLIPDAVGGTEFMHGISGGVEALPHVIRAYLATHEGHVVAKTDTANAFNSVSRPWILAASRRYPTLVALADLLYGRESTVVYSDRKSGRHVDIPFNRGANQGCPLAALLYSTSLRWAIDAVLLRCPAVTIRGVADDRFFMGPLSDVLDALDLYKSELAKQSQLLQCAKTSIYLPTTPARDGRSSIAFGCAQRGYAAVTGFMVAGSPVGDLGYCLTAVDDYFSAIALKLAAVRKLSTISSSPQEIYRVIRHCIAPAAISYLIRTTPPEHIIAQASLFDTATFHVILSLLKVPQSDPAWDPTTSAGLIAATISHLSASAGGLGITSAAAIASTAYASSLLLTMPLIAAVLPDGYTPDDMALLFPSVAAILSDPNRPNSLDDVTFTTLRTTAVPKVQRALIPAFLRIAIARALNLITLPAARATFLSGTGNGALWLMGRPQHGDPLSPAQFTILVKSRLLLPTVDG